MIRLPNINLPTTPDDKLKDYQADVDGKTTYAEKVAEGKRLFSSRNTRSNATFRAVRQKLTEMCAGAQRCVYCEDSVGDEVEHIKPKDLYPEAVFRWDNYVYACGRCNGHKSNKFAVIDDDEELIVVTRPRGATVDPPAPGQSAFVNPREEDALTLFEVDLVDTFMILPAFDLEASALQRAEFTIETLDLNRDVLIEARRNAFSGYRARLFEYGMRKVLGDDLSAFRAEFLSSAHPTIWEEIKRQGAGLGQNIPGLLDANPEVMGWTVAA